MWGVSVGQFKCQRPKTFGYSHPWPSSLQRPLWSSGKDLHPWKRLLFTLGSLPPGFSGTVVTSDWSLALRINSLPWALARPTLATNVENPMSRWQIWIQNGSRSSSTIQQLLINAAVLVWNHVKHLGYFGCQALGVLAICPTKVRQDTCTVTQPVEGPDPLSSW